jgi:hypothetical protein
MEEMMRRWLAANEDAEAAGDWRALADFYTEDAEYSWNLGPNEDFVARGREQIRDWVHGHRDGGPRRLEYPYERVLVDERRARSSPSGARWRRRSARTARRTRVRGLGGSWFRYAATTVVVAARLLRLRERDGAASSS